jgi:predicted Zn-ribbon and HTH transcriptional regulator
MIRGIYRKSIELSLKCNFEPIRPIVEVHITEIHLPIAPEVCNHCGYNFIPTERNETCLLCIRGIDRTKLEKLELLMSLIY